MVKTDPPELPRIAENKRAFLLSEDKVIVFAQGYYGIFHLAEYSLLLGVKLKNVPPEVGSPQQVLAKFKLPAGG